METTKVYMGEVVDPTSPEISEQEAIENASFGKYTYQPGIMQNTGVSLPGWQGYSTNPNGQQGFYQQPNIFNTYGYIGQMLQQQQYYANTYGGIGMNPYVNNMYQQQYMGNPAFRFGYQAPVRQSQYIQVPPLSYGGEYLPPPDYEQTLSDLSSQFWVKEQEESVKHPNNYAYNPYNYYGGLFGYGYGYNNPIRNEANNIITKMKAEARENRISFNLNLGKLAYNLAYGKGNYDEKALEELFRGRTIENPLANGIYEQANEQKRFENCVPFDNSSDYQAFHAAVTAQHNSIINPENGLQGLFENSGKLWYMYMMEEEMHRRRQLNGTYNSDVYKYIIKRSIAERNAREDQRFSSNNNSYQMNNLQAPPAYLGNAGSMGIYTGNPRNGLQQQKLEYLKEQGKQFSCIDANPTLDSNGDIVVNLSVPQNFGSNAGKVYTVNSNEQAYDKKREEFQRYLDTIPKSIYSLSPGGG